MYDPFETTQPGVYSVEVVNSGGGTVSEPALLTVERLPDDSEFGTLDIGRI